MYREISRFIHTQSPELEQTMNLRKFIVKNHSPIVLSGFKKDQSRWNQMLIRHFSYPPIVYHKGNRIDRIINANRIKCVIKNNKFEHIGVPEKCLIARKELFSSPLLPWGYHPVWDVTAKALPNNAVKDISLSEVQELAQFVVLTGYQDFEGPEHNILRDPKTEKIVFFDTEDASFTNPWCRTKTQLIANLLSLRSIMTSEASFWLEAHLETISKEPQVEITPIHRNADYDTQGVNLDLVIKEYEEVNPY